MYILGLLKINMVNKKATAGWLVWALIFLVIAFVAGMFGFGFISGVSFIMARWLAMIFVILFIISVIAHTIKAA